MSTNNGSDKNVIQKGDSVESKEPLKGKTEESLKDGKSKMFDQIDDSKIIILDDDGEY